METSIITLFALSLIFNTSFGMMKPGQNLKMPGEVVEEIREFKKSVEKDDACYRINHPKEYVKEMRKAERLVYDALFAYYLCDVYKSKDLIDFENFIHEYQVWARDPERFNAFKGSSPEMRGEEYSDSLEVEREKILTDCQSCSTYKEQLIKHIEDLQGFVLYRKPRVEDDEKFENEEKSSN